MKVGDGAGRHIGVDATCWMLKRGFGRHARCLLRALMDVDTRNRYTFFIDAPEVRAELPLGAGVRVVGVRSPTIEAASADGHRRLRDVMAMSRALSSADLDVVFFPTLFSYVPTFGRARRFLMMHDATAEMYPTMALGGWKNRMLWRAKTAVGRRQADVLLTVSHYSRDTIERLVGVEKGRLHVVGEASDAVFRVLDRPGVTPVLRKVGFDPARRSVVFVGGFSPHKNLAALVGVFARVARLPGLDDVMLFLVGERERETFVNCRQELERQIESLGLAGRAVFTGFLEDEDLVAMLNLATVLALPSLTEGVGLTALEAAACGCPVIATTQSPLPDLLGRGGRYVDPRDEEALERALVEVLSSEDVRREMRAEGLAAAGRLSWNSAASRLVHLFENGAP